MGQLSPPPISRHSILSISKRVTSVLLVVIFLLMTFDISTLAGDDQTVPENVVEAAVQEMDATSLYWTWIYHEAARGVIIIGGWFASHGVGYLLLESPGLVTSLATGHLLGLGNKIASDLVVTILATSTKNPRSVCLGLSKAERRLGWAEYHRAYEIARKYRATGRLTAEDAEAFMLNRWGLKRMEIARKLYNDAVVEEDPEPADEAMAVSAELIVDQAVEKYIEATGLPDNLPITDAASLIKDCFDVFRENAAGIYSYQPYLDFQAAMMEFNERRAAEMSRFGTAEPVAGEIDEIEIPEQVEYDWDVPSELTLRSEYATFSKDRILALERTLGLFDAQMNPQGHSWGTFELRTIGTDQVVLDHLTGLVWHQSGATGPRLQGRMTFTETEGWLEEFNRSGYAGFNDWRFPTVDEALTLLSETRHKTQWTNNYLDPLFDIRQSGTFTGDRSPDGMVWAVDYKGAYVTTYGEERGVCWVRPVRSSDEQQQREPTFVGPEPINTDGVRRYLATVALWSPHKQGKQFLEHWETLPADAVEVAFEEFANARGVSAYKTIKIHTDQGQFQIRPIPYLDQESGSVTRGIRKLLFAIDGKTIGLFEFLRGGNRYDKTRLYQWSDGVIEIRVYGVVHGWADTNINCLSEAVVEAYIIN